MYAFSFLRLWILFSSVCVVACALMCGCRSLEHSPCISFSLHVTHTTNILFHWEEWETLSESTRLFLDHSVNSPSPHFTNALRFSLKFIFFQHLFSTSFSDFIFMHSDGHAVVVNIVLVILACVQRSTWIRIEKNCAVIVTNWMAQPLHGEHIRLLCKYFKRSASRSAMFT